MVEVVLLIAVALTLAFALGALVQLGRTWSRSRAADTGRSREADELRERLRTAEADRERTALVLSSMPEGVLLFGAGGDTVYANPAAERHLGVVPQSITAVLPLAIREATLGVRESRDAAEAEAETGGHRWVRGSAIPVGAGDVLLVVRDVTEARRLDEIRRDFVANASHELKTPAASIQAAAETIRSAVLDDPGVLPGFAGQLEREAERLSRIISDLLDLSRLESGSDLTEAVALDAIIHEEAARFEEAAAEAGIELSVDVGDAPHVRGSARDLSLLVRNLIDNAIRYTRPGGRVVLGLTTAGDDAVLTVSDTGVGIPTRDLPRVFERFYRVDRARSRETGGTGLGLSIVRHVVENHGGRVSVGSELGRGTRFEVRLPAAG
jgi:two-component system, OmpR family, phosphate regulon sensor histidine kinase PhoR